MTGPPAHLNTRELAEYLRTTPAAIRKMRERGTGPRGFRVGRGTLYRRVDVELWLATKQDNQI